MVSSAGPQEHAERAVRCRAIVSVCPSSSTRAHGRWQRGMVQCATSARSCRRSRSPGHGFANCPFRKSTLMLQAAVSARGGGTPRTRAPHAAIAGAIPRCAISPAGAGRLPSIQRFVCRARRGGATGSRARAVRTAGASLVGPHRTSEIRRQTGRCHKARRMRASGSRMPARRTAVATELASTTDPGPLGTDREKPQRPAPARQERHAQSEAHERRRAAQGVRAAARAGIRNRQVQGGGGSKGDDFQGTIQATRRIAGNRFERR